jgi:hypothetical protein
VKWCAGDNVFSLLVDQSVDILYVISRLGSLTIFRLPTLERVYTESLTSLWSYHDTMRTSSMASISPLAGWGSPSQFNHASNAHLLFDAPGGAPQVATPIISSGPSSPTASGSGTVSVTASPRNPSPPATLTVAPTSPTTNALERIAVPRGIVIVDDDGTIWSVRILADMRKYSDELKRAWAAKDNQWKMMANASDDVYTAVGQPSHAQLLIQVTPDPSYHSTTLSQW